MIVGLQVWLGWRQVTEGLGVLFELQLLLKIAVLGFFIRKVTLGKPLPKELFSMHWNEEKSEAVR